MGEYTGIRCKVIVKPEYREELNFLNSKEIQYEWSESNIDFLREYGEYPRATFIPRGMLSYMPDDWEDENERATDGFERNFNNESGLWSFQCSLKNYDLTIQYFFEEVLSKIAELVIHLEYYYEDAVRSTFYELVGEKITESDREGIVYY
ncbi:hypothetical protein WGM54_14215 [Paenibacillus polymyxa]|uniref:hypothetical protein n=1 Tax=Paenibacillus polymyxa TaxID=1406 RepID=UPI00307CFBFC